MEPGEVTHEFVGNALKELRKRTILQNEDMVVVVAGNFGRSKGVSFVEIGSVESLIAASLKN
jgi:pyruvate kinase